MFTARKIFFLDAHLPQSLENVAAALSSPAVRNSDPLPTRIRPSGQPEWTRGGRVVLGTAGGMAAALGVAVTSCVVDVGE